MEPMSSHALALAALKARRSRLLAFSALPDAPQLPDTEPGRLRSAARWWRARLRREIPSISPAPAANGDRARGCTACPPAGWGV